MRTWLRTTIDVWLLAQVVVRQSSHDQLDGFRRLTEPTQPSPISAVVIADKRNDVTVHAYECRAGVRV